MILSVRGSAACVLRHLSFPCFEILSGPCGDIFWSQSTPCNDFGTPGGKWRCGGGGGGDFCIIAVYFCGKSLVRKICIWGTFKVWHVNPWLRSLELPFAWWHLKLDHPRPPGCQTAATLAWSNSRGMGRGCLLKKKKKNKCLLGPCIIPNKQPQSKGFFYLAQPEKVSCSRQGQRKMH